MVGKVYWIY